MTLPRVEHMIVIAMIAAKGVQYTVGLFIAAGCAPAWLLRVKAGLDDICTNLPLTAFKQTSVVQAEVAK